jgi:hypothetical protein
VNLFATLWKAIDPATKDYNEVVLRADALPTIISVDDPLVNGPKP